MDLKQRWVNYNEAGGFRGASGFKRDAEIKESVSKIVKQLK